MLARPGAGIDGGHEVAAGAMEIEPIHRAVGIVEGGADALEIPGFDAAIDDDGAQVRAVGNVGSQRRKCQRDNQSRYACHQPHDALHRRLPIRA